MFSAHTVYTPCTIYLYGSVMDMIIWITPLHVYNLISTTCYCTHLYCSSEVFMNSVWQHNALLLCPTFLISAAL